MDNQERRRNRSKENPRTLAGSVHMDWLHEESTTLRSWEWSDHSKSWRCTTQAQQADRLDRYKCPGDYIQRITGSRRCDHYTKTQGHSSDRALIQSQDRSKAKASKEALFNQPQQWQWNKDPENHWRRQRDSHDSIRKGRLLQRRHEPILHLRMK